MSSNGKPTLRFYLTSTTPQDGWGFGNGLEVYIPNTAIFYTVDNTGNVVTTTTKTTIIDPKGWDTTEWKFLRSINSAGVVSQITGSYEYSLDGKKILDYLYETQGVEMKCGLYIEMLNTTTQTYSVAFAGLISGKTISVGKWTTMAAAIQGGAAMFLAANKDTKYKIDIKHDDPAMIPIWHDGIMLQSTFNYTPFISNPTFVVDLQDNWPAFTGIANDEYAAGIINNPIQFSAFSLNESNNYFYKALRKQVVNIDCKIGIRLLVDSTSSNVNFELKLKKYRLNPDGTVVSGSETTIANDTAGPYNHTGLPVIITLDGSVTSQSLERDEYLMLFVTSTVTGTITSHFTFLQTSVLNVTAQYQTNPNIVFGFRAADLWDKLIYSATNGNHHGYSSYFQRTDPTLNWDTIPYNNIITCGDALRQWVMNESFGYITCNTGSAAVTGIGTNFSTYATAGDTLYIGGVSVGVISSIADSTHLTLSTNASISAVDVTYLITGGAVGQETKPAMARGLTLQNDYTSIYWSVSDFLAWALSKHGCEMGIEKDDSGNDMVVVEPLNYHFNQTTQIADLGEVIDLTQTVNTDRIFNTLAIGTQSETIPTGLNGRYEINATTNLLMPIVSMSKANSQVSSIKDGVYAIEAARNNTGSKVSDDFQNDNETFCIEIDTLSPTQYCDMLPSSPLWSDTYSVNAYQLYRPQNLLAAMYSLPVSTFFDFYPDYLQSTIYNLGLTPRRCFNRHIQHVAITMDNITSDIKYIFDPKNQWNLPTSITVREFAVTLYNGKVKENVDIVNSSIPDPIIRPTYITATVPITKDTFKQLQSALCKGYFKISCKGKDYYGYIDDVNFNPTNKAAYSLKLLKRYAP